MKPIYIESVGILSPAACSEEELLRLADKILEGKTIEQPDFSTPVEFSLGVPISKVRRASRYAKMAVATAGQATTKLENKAATGTIFLTGYGSVESYATFTDSVVDGVPSLASPTVFSYTVPNSCLGQTCIAHGFRGSSTMLLAGDPTEYAALLLNVGSAERMLCGAIEERNNDLCASFSEAGVISGEIIADGAAMLLLSNVEGNFGSLKGFSSVSLVAYPYTNEFSLSQRQDSEIAVTEALGIFKANSPDIILATGNGSYFDEIEGRACREVFGDTPKLCKSKKFFGESLSASYLENMALGACLLRKAKENGKNYKVITTGLDTHGNYLAALMEV